MVSLPDKAIIYASIFAYTTADRRREIVNY
jgi:V-type H+-transporting ATPase subunit H